MNKSHDSFSEGEELFLKVEDGVDVLEARLGDVERGWSVRVAEFP